MNRDADRAPMTLATATGREGLAAVEHDIGVTVRHLEALRRKARELRRELRASSGSHELRASSGSHGTVAP